MLLSCVGKEENFDEVILKHLCRWRILYKGNSVGHI